MTPAPPVLHMLTADIVARDDRSVTIRTDAGRYADLPLAHIEVTPVDDGRHVIEMPTWLAADMGVL